MESGISSRHENFKLADNESLEWLAQWQKLESGIGKGMIAVIIGERGAGKTQMAVCAIRVSCKLEHSSKFTKALSFFLDVRSAYKKDSDSTEKMIIEKYCAPKMLVIDAIENRSDSSFENLLLNHLIDIRYDRCLDTILIGNFDEKQFAASMGMSIVDRIHECGIKIVCNWKSFRRT
jgi:DNA replication protein DnaC